MERDFYDLRIGRYPVLAAFAFQPSTTLMDLALEEKHFRQLFLCFVPLKQVPHWFAVQWQEGFRLINLVMSSSN